MSLRNGLLGLLAGRAMSGYELARQFDSSLRYVWSASHSQIYPELARLEERGLIAQSEHGPRGRKRYSVTDAGRDHLHHWLTATEPERASRDESTLRFFFLWMLEPGEATAALQREREFHRRDLEEYEGIEAHLFDSGTGPPWGRLPIELGVRYKRAMLEWLDWALEEVGHPAAKREISV